MDCKLCLDFGEIFLSSGYPLKKKKTLAEHGCTAELPRVQGCSAVWMWVCHCSSSCFRLYTTNKCHDIPVLLGPSVTSRQKLHRPGVNDKNSLFISRASSFLVGVPLPVFHKKLAITSKSNCLPSHMILFT